MPLYMDIHEKIQGATPDDVAAAHQADLAVGAEHGVSYLRYWFNAETGKVFCLAEGPSMEAVDTVHRVAHGLAADKITEVVEGE